MRLSSLSFARLDYLLVHLLAVLPLMAGLVACQPAGSGAPKVELIIEHGRVIVGDGTVHEEASVLVAGDSILSVTKEDVEAPDALRIDASGRTVLPGLIDAHVHLTIPGDTQDSTAVLSHIEEDLPGILQDFLEHGVTTVRSTGDYWPWIGELREQVAAGQISGPRIVTSGPILTAKGGHPASTACRNSAFCRRNVTREVTGPKEAQEAVRQLARAGVDFIKLVSDSILAPVQIEEEVVRAIVDQAHQEGLKAVGHVPEAALVERAAHAGLDEFIHSPTLPSGMPDRTRELAEVLADRGTPVTTTLYVVLAYTGGSITDIPARPDVVESQARRVDLLADAGVPIVVGTDWCPCNPGDDPAFKPGAVTLTEMKSLRWGGMSREAIIEAATANAARALEMSDQIGTLEVGKLADLIVVEGNPLENLSALEDPDVVVQGGEVVAGEPNGTRGSNQ